MNILFFSIWFQFAQLIQIKDNERCTNWKILQTNNPTHPFPKLFSISLIQVNVKNCSENQCEKLFNRIRFRFSLFGTFWNLYNFKSFLYMSRKCVFGWKFGRSRRFSSIKFSFQVYFNPQTWAFFPHLFWLFTPHDYL